MIEKLVNLPEYKVERLFKGFFVLVFAWLLGCAWLIEGEYGDGYSTIINSRYFFADTSKYLTQRGPVAAIMLFPVEMVVKIFQLHPLDVRPYHFYSTFIHGVYILGCWKIISKQHGKNLATFLAFVGAIFSITFVAFSPYLSHDIIPGFLFLILIYCAKKWLETSLYKWAIMSIFVGASVVLIKQTYAIFWLAIVIAVLVGLITNRRKELYNINTLFLIFCFASVSALVSWFGYAFISEQTYPDTSVFLRPFKIISAVTNHYSKDPNFDGEWENLFPWTLYWTNLPNYGIGVMTLIIPSLFFSLRRKNEYQFMIAVCWIVCFVIILSIGAREARYLAFLAPLTAMLVVPVIKLISINFYKLYLILLLVIAYDLSRGITLSIAYISNAGSMEMRNFLAPIDDLVDSKSRLIFARGVSFTFLQKSPLLKDRYHGIYHLVRGQIGALYQEKIDVVTFKNLYEINSNTVLVGDVLILNNGTIVRSPPWRDDNKPYMIEKFIQLIGKVVELKLTKDDEGFKINSENNRYYMLLLEHSMIPLDDISRNKNELQLIIDKKIPIELARKYYGKLADNPEIEVKVLEVTRFCYANNCDFLN